VITINRLESLQVMIYNFRDGGKWVSGKIVDELGPVLDLQKSAYIVRNK